LGNLLTKKIPLKNKMRSRLKSENACYGSVQNLFSSNLIAKNVKINILSCQFLCGCEIWSLTLREECRLRVFENKVLRRMFEPKRDEVTGEWRRLHNGEL
jgi:hypothetical protein